MRALAHLSFAVVLLLSEVAAHAQAGMPVPKPLPAITLTVGKHKVTTEVAASPEQRATGLMYRFSLKPDHGMLFVFERPERLGFWMKNTYIPLSIAFIDAQGRILNIEDMAPQTETSHWSQGPALYALEMRKGWFVERGISPGDPVAGLPKPRP